MWTPPLDATVDMYRRRQDLQQQKKRSIPRGIQIPKPQLEEKDNTDQAQRKYNS